MSIIHGHIKPAAIPPWAYEGATPSVYTFFEAIALSNLEGRDIKLDAETQRALLGFPVFGRRVIRVKPEGVVESTVTVSFGQDFESGTYSADMIRRAASAQKQLRPGTTGRKYLALNE